MSDVLRVENVSLSFGGLEALSGVDLAVPDGSIVGLIGPNGAGKTTLLDVLSGMLRADSGKILFNGQDISGIPVEKRAALGIGRSFQNLGLVNDQSVLTNLMAAQHLSAGYNAWELVLRPWRWWREEQRIRARAVDAAAAFGLREHLDAPLAELSFAAARFTELAGVLIDEPRLLLLDEPTTGLDLNEVERLFDALGHQREQGRTILVVAHDVKFVMSLCDHVYVLMHGRLLVDGPPALVQRDERVIQAYLGTHA